MATKRRVHGRRTVGDTTRRGYGTQFQRIRAQWKIKVDAGHVNCWRCGRWLNPNAAWHLGHDDHDRSIIRGPECAHCNLSAAARKTNAMRRRKAGMTSAVQPIRSRRW